MALTIEFKAKASKTDRFKYQMAKDFRKFARDELAKECRRYFDMANKRISRLQSSGTLSPALQKVLDSGGKFYARGANLKQLQHEYARCINFLNMDTSTVTGAKELERRIEQKLGGHKLSRDQIGTLFKAFRAIEKASPAGVQAYGSDRLVQYLANEMDTDNKDILNGAGSQDWEKMIEDAIKEVGTAYDEFIDEFNRAFTDVFTIK